MQSSNNGLSGSCQVAVRQSSSCFHQICDSLHSLWDPTTSYNYHLYSWWFQSSLFWWVILTPIFLSQESKGGVSSDVKKWYQIMAEVLKVSKSQKHFFLEIILPESKWNIRQNRVEFWQTFCLFIGQWSFKKKCFWDLQTFSTNVHPQPSHFEDES